MRIANLKKAVLGLMAFASTLVAPPAAPLAAVAALVGIDQLIKLWAVQVLQPVGAMPLIPHVVELRFVLNQGMAFSLLSGKQLFLIIATSIALIFVAYGLFFRSRGRYLQQAALLRGSDVADIAGYGIMRTPGLVVDEQVLVSGRVPKAAEIAQLLSSK